LCNISFLQLMNIFSFIKFKITNFPFGYSIFFILLIILLVNYQILYKNLDTDKIYIKFENMRERYFILGYILNLAYIVISILLINISLENNNNN
jgi:hypothetical protein